MHGDYATETAMMMLAAAVAVLAYSSVLLFRARKRGDLDRILARAIVDPATRKVLLSQIAVVNTMFIWTGIAFGLTQANLLGDTLGDLFAASTFTVGAVVMLVEVRQGLRISSLSMQAELELRDTQPEVFEALVTKQRGELPASVAGWMVFPVEQAHSGRESVAAWSHTVDSPSSNWIR